MKNKLQKIAMYSLYTFLIVILFQSCIEYEPDYNYKYTAKITYQNGDIDTLSFNRESFKGNKVYVYIKTTESGIISSSSISPCLVIACGFYKKTIACGVRKYEIISESKEPIESRH